MARDASKKEYAKQQLVQFSAQFSENFGKSPLAFVHSFGCQQNVSDGEKIKGQLSDIGFGFTDDYQQAQLILFNTCAVRENAEDKVFGTLGDLKHFKEQNPDTVIAVCGCMAQEESMVRLIAERCPQVDLLFGTHNLERFPLLLSRALSGERVIEVESDGAGSVVEGMPVARSRQYKAFVYIMYFIRIM